MAASTSADTAGLNKSMADLSLVRVGPLLGISENDTDTKDFLLPIEPLYKLCMKYYKDNIGKALAIAYEEKTKLLALHKQVTCGKYRPGTENEPGFLDVVGNDRKVAWQELGDMSREDAMKEFVKLLHKCSPSLKPYIIAFKVKQDEEERLKKLEEEEKRRKAEEEAEIQRQLEASKQVSDAQRQQEQQVRQALNQQTEAQFKAYAQTHYPNDEAQQKILIKQLQEQHFQQYVRQVYEQQMKTQQTGELTSASSTLKQAGPTRVSPNLASQPGIANSLTKETHNEQINGQQELSPPPAELVIQEASMWTQKDIVAFKNAIKKESRMENHTDCIIKVGSGETVTIRVPTHENGNCLFWEFATDHYDIAFGVYFEWTSSPDDNVQVQISESSDEDDEEMDPNEKSDPEKGGDEVIKPTGPPVDEIIPIYRRDCHEEVYCGSHVYPGRGVYLLKFDNSFSLWRSKTLYYRVYYSR